MRKYLPKLIQILTGPVADFQQPFFSLSRILSKRKHLKQCLKVWKYSSEDELDRDLALSYFRLLEGIKERDDAMVLRHLSVDLFQKYQNQPQAFSLEPKISDVVILDCKKVSKGQAAVTWFQLSVKFKHFNCSKYYQMESKRFEDSFSLQSTSPRKWYFLRLPLELQPQIQPHSQPHDQPK